MKKTHGLKIKQKVPPPEPRTTLYTEALLTKTVSLEISSVGGPHMETTLETALKHEYEGKCGVDGYVKPNSLKIQTYSSGIIERGNILTFYVSFTCQVCQPVEGMVFACTVKNITKAGIRAESATDFPSPIVVFVPRDHAMVTHHASHHPSAAADTFQARLEAFQSAQIDDKILVKVAGQRFELGDKFVSIIGDLVV